MGSNNKKEKVPEISIDEALRLFIAVAFPQGIPDGEEGQQVMRALKEKIAEDRPEWAVASDLASQTPNSKEPVSEAVKSYAAMKAEMVKKASEENIPEDSYERYFYFRDKEAKEQRQQKKLEAQEQEIRERLIQRLQEQKSGVHNTSLGKMLQIRQLLESSILPKLKLNGSIAEEEKNTNRLRAGKLEYETGLSNTPPLQQGISSGYSLSSSPGSPNGGGIRELERQALNGLDKEEKIELLRGLAGTKRAQLATRDELLSARRPPPNLKKDNGFSLEGDGGKNSIEGSRANSKKNSLEFSNGPGKKSSGIKIK